MGHYRKILIAAALVWARLQLWSPAFPIASARRSPRSTVCCLQARKAEAAARIASYAMGFARSVANAAAMFVVALVLTVYFLIEWKATVEWLMAFVPSEHRQKARRTLSEARETVYRYVIGNAMTSLITAVATFIVLLALKVPAALMLALIAGLLDFIPIVGFLLSLAVTALLAATVSVTTLLAVVAFYLLLNALQNYVIMPRVYGHELALSNLAVLIAVAVGGQLGGVMGALLTAPVGLGQSPAISLYR